MKTMKLGLIVWLLVVMASWATNEYVWYDPLTGLYKPAAVNSAINATSQVPYWARYVASSNINANYKNLLNVRTGWFDVIYLAGVRLGTTSTGGVVAIPEDSPISGAESDGSVPSTITYRDIPDRYSEAAFWYPFDYDSAVILDSSGNGRHALKRPSAEPMVWSSYAMQGSKVREDYLVQINSNGVAHLAPELTFGAWVYLTSSVTNNNVFLSAGGTTNRVEIWADQTGTYSVVMGTGNQTSQISYAYGTNLCTGAWHRIISTYKKAGASGSTGAIHCLWMDGTQVSSNTVADNFFVGNKSRFMVNNTDGAPTNNRFVDGLYDDTFVARTAWTGADVTNDWYVGRSMGIYEYHKSAPLVPELLNPPNLSTIYTNTPVTLSWSPSTVASSYRVEMGTNASVLTNVVTTTESTYSFGKTLLGRTNFWRVGSSNVYGLSMASPYSFLPTATSFSTNLFTNFALYCDMYSDQTNSIIDKNPRLGVDSLARVGGGTTWEDYSVKLNGDGAYGDYLTSAGTAYSNANGSYSIGFWYAQRVIPTSSDQTLFRGAMWDSVDYYYDAGMRINQIATNRKAIVELYVQYTNITDHYDDAMFTQVEVTFTSNQFEHFVYVFEDNSYQGITSHSKLYFNGVLVDDDETATAGIIISRMRWPVTFGIGASTANPYWWGKNPDGKFDDIFITDRAITADEVNSIYLQGRSLNVTY